MIKKFGKWIGIALVVIVVIAVIAGGGGEEETSNEVGDVQANVTSESNIDETANNDLDESTDSDDDESIDSEDDEAVQKAEEVLENIISKVKGDKSTDSGKNKEAKDGDTFYPGDVVSFDGFKITYQSVGKYEAKNQFLEPKDGYQYIKFNFKFVNTGKSDAYIGSFDCYAKGEKCESAYVDGAGGDFLLTKISSGRKVSGSLLYEVPKGIKMKNIELEYKGNSLWSDKKIIFLGK